MYEEAVGAERDVDGAFDVDMLGTNARLFAILSQHMSFGFAEGRIGRLKGYGHFG